MVIPFQAVEVYLDNVVPADSKSCLFRDKKKQEYRRCKWMIRVNFESFLNEEKKVRRVQIRYYAHFLDHEKNNPSTRDLYTQTHPINKSTRLIGRKNWLKVKGMFWNIDVFFEKNRHLLLWVDQEDFTPDSIELVKTTILGSSFKAMVTGYHYDNTPFIQLSKRYDFVSLFT